MKNSQNIPHAASFASLLHKETKRRFPLWTGRQNWAESMTMGWDIYKCITRALNGDNGKAEETALAAAEPDFVRYGNFLAVNTAWFFVVVNIETFEIVRIYTSKGHRLVDACDLARDLNRAAERKAGETKETAKAGATPQMIERFLTTNNWPTT